MLTVGDQLPSFNVTGVKPKFNQHIEDGKSGNRKLAIGCVYCKFKEKCWSESNEGKGLRVFKYSNGNRYLTQVVKTPDVQEIYLN